MYLARSIDQISQSIRSAFARFLPGTDSSIVQNFLYGTRKTLALMLKEVDLRSEYIHSLIFVRTADDYHVENRHAPEYGIVRKPAGFAVGNVDLVVSGAMSLPQGVRFLSGGVTYYSTSDVSAVGAETLSVPVKALSSGPDGNRSSGERMALAEPGSYPLAENVGYVDGSSIAGGSEKENLDALKSRILDRKRKPPQGGNEADYERYAVDQSYVSRAWARRPDGGAGALHIWFLNADGDAPSQSEIDQLEEYLHGLRLLGLRDLAAYAPTDDPLTVTVELLPDTEELRERVTSAVEAVVLERSRPGLPPKQPGGTDDDFVLYRSWISEAISVVIGEDSHVLVAPAAAITYGTGEMPLTVSVGFQ